MKVSYFLILLMPGDIVGIITKNNVLERKPIPYLTSPKCFVVKSQPEVQF